MSTFFSKHKYINPSDARNAKFFFQYFRNSISDSIILNAVTKNKLPMFKTFIYEFH